MYKRMISIYILKPPDEIKAFATKSNKSGPKAIPGMAPTGNIQANKNIKNKDKSDSKSTIKEVIHSSNQKKSKDLDHEMKEVNTELQNISISNNSILNNDHNNIISTKIDHNSDIDLSKRIKALTKKLRDINDIELKPKDTLTIEQLEKISKKIIIENELQELKKIEIKSS